MKRILITAFAISALSLSIVAISQATPFPENYMEDKYLGPSVSYNNNIYTVDSFDADNLDTDDAGGSRFDLSGYSFITNGSNLSLTIYAEWYFSEGIQKYGLGDLFIATNYNSSFLEDTNFSGWDYVVDLDYPILPSDNREAGEYTLNGIATLYTIVQENVKSGVYREDYAYYTPKNDETSLGDYPGNWNISEFLEFDGKYYDTLTITMDLASMGWNGTSDLLMQFTQVCGNDILRMEITGAPIPEPSTLLLFGSGLLGLAGFARRRHNN